MFIVKAVVAQRVTVNLAVVGSILYGGNWVPPLTMQGSVSTLGSLYLHCHMIQREVKKEHDIYRIKPKHNAYYNISKFRSKF